MLTKGAVLGSFSVTCMAMACGADVLEGAALSIPVNAEGRSHPVTSADLISLREIGGVSGKGLSVSPDGNYLAFEAHQADVESNNYRVAWFVASITAGGVAINVGDGGDATLFRAMGPNGRIGGSWVAEYPKWSPDSEGIAYRKAVDEEIQVWWSSRDGEDTVQLTHNAADVESFHWSSDGSKIYFTTDAPRAELRRAAESRYREGYVFDYNKDWSAIDGRPYYLPYLLSGGRPRVWVLDVGGRTEHIASADELVEYDKLSKPTSSLRTPTGARQTAWTSEKGSVAWLQPDNPDRQGRNPPMTLYASIVPDGREVIRCPATECTGIFDPAGPLRNGLKWNASEDEILFVRKEGTGYSKRALYGWRIGEDHARKILSSDEWISDCSIVRDRVICFRQTPTYPRTIVSIDIADGSIETLVDPNPKFDNVLLGHVELLEWENSEGHPTFGYVVKPPDYVPGQRYPFVVVGYRARTALRGGVGDEYPVHLFAANGFVVLVYDRPTNYEADETYSDSLAWSRANWGGDLFDYRMSLSSFESAIRILGNKGLIDPTRVGVTGLSNGVGHVNYALIHSELFSAAITSASDFGSSNYFLIGSSNKLFRKHRSLMGIGRYGTPEGHLWETMSLALNADRMKTPLLVNAGQHEHPWALEEIITLIENNKPVELVVHPDEHHIKWQPAHRAAIYERNVDWFSFWLRDVEDSNPEKGPQYARWRKLREQHNNNIEAAGKGYTLPLLPVTEAQD